MPFIIAGTKVDLVHSDITALDVDAVVVPQFRDSVSWGGVGHAVAKAGALAGMHEYGRLLRDEGPRRFGSARACEAGGGKARWLVHVASVAYDGEGEDADMVRYCVSNALAEAADVGARSVALPAIGTGIIGTLTLTESARAIASGINDHAASGLPAVDVTVAIHGDPDALRIFEATLAGWAGPDSLPCAMGDLEPLDPATLTALPPPKASGLRAALAAVAGRLRLSGPGPARAR